MDNDDLPVGRVLSRREALKILAGASVAVLAGCRPADEGAALVGETPAATTAAATTAAATTAAATSAATATGVPAPTSPAASPTLEAAPTCVVRPEMTEGPYFVDEKLNRSDVRADSATGAVSAGVPLLLAFRVSQISDGSCTPLPDAIVDIWHCDAEGVYSEFESGAGADFLRGYQVTDADGLARFTTIYPGWYQGRTVHIHFKIRVPHGSGTYEFTSQLFFDDAYTDAVYSATAPYNARPNRSTRNGNDGIYRAGGDQLLLAVAEQDGGHAATFDIALDLSDSAVGAADGNVGPGGGGDARPGG